MKIDMEFRLAKENELFTIMELYNEAKQSEFCVWNEFYPTINEINEDYKTKNLYVYLIENEIVGAISVVPENELDEIMEWTVKEKVKEIARVVVRKQFQGNNISFKMVINIIGILKKQNYKAIHLSCQCDNIPAIKTYKKLGFNFICKKDLFGHKYYICEYLL